MLASTCERCLTLVSNHRERHPRLGQEVTGAGDAHRLLVAVDLLEELLLAVLAVPAGQARE